MSVGPACEETRALAPELALGIADGEERARALRHLASCPECRRLVDGYNELADELLELAPTHEPPLGFESRVLERMELRSPRRPSRVRRLMPAFAAAGVAVAVTFAAMTITYSGDHDLAQSYRATLAQANGEAFEAARLTGPGGTEAGTVFAYDGTPSWILVTVDQQARERGLRGELITTSGERVSLPGFSLDADNGSWGGAIPIAAERVSQVRLLGKARGQVLEAHLPRPGQNPLYVEDR